ncbi:hypothetical protein [Microvirga massiliensis]|nr:hypothetical protein [Microvirga massiliensis]
MTLIQVYALVTPLILIGIGLLAVRWSRKVARDYDETHRKHPPS